ncbi:MAG: hypothetical protein GX537_07295 [Actinobacteria bacterium]|nr:hypothetical protein [Actinomycetota bacterium]
MRPDSHDPRFEGNELGLSARHEQVLRDTLRGSASSIPPPPAELPVSLLRAVRQEAPSGVLGATSSLIWAQWPVVTRERLVLGMAVALALVFCAAGGLTDGFDLLVLSGTLPVIAALVTLLLSGPWSDPAHALVSATRTPFGALVFARTTVVLVLLVGLSLAGTLVLTFLGDTSFPTLVAAWLAPTVILAALATLLAQLWRPVITVAIALAAWASVVLLAALELNGVISPAVSLRLVYQPNSAHVLVQALVALGAVVAAWSSGSRPGLTRPRS